MTKKSRHRMRYSWRIADFTSDARSRLKSGQPQSYTWLMGSHTCWTDSMQFSIGQHTGWFGRAAAQRSERTCRLTVLQVKLRREPRFDGPVAAQSSSWIVSPNTIERKMDVCTRGIGVSPIHIHCSWFDTVAGSRQYQFNASGIKSAIHQEYPEH